MAEPDLGGARRGGRRDGAVRGEQEAAVDEEPAPAFASSSSPSPSAVASEEGYGSYGGALCGKEPGLDPLQLSPAGAEAPPRGVAQDPHPATLALPLPLLLLLPLLRQAAAGATDGDAERPVWTRFGFVLTVGRRGRDYGSRGQCAYVNVLCDYCCLLDLVSS